MSRSGGVARLFCYIFAHEFLCNLHFNLEPDKKGNMTQNSTVYLCMEILPIFWHTSRSSISTPCRHWNRCIWNCKICRKPCQKQPLPLEARGLPSNTWVPGPTPLTTPNDSSISLRNSTQRRNKVPINYNGTPQIHPHKLPLPLRRSPPKSNTDLISRFATIHMCGQTDVGRHGQYQ